MKTFKEKAEVVISQLRQDRDSLLKENEDMKKSIEQFKTGLFKMKDDRDFFGNSIDKERWETITAVIELFGDCFPNLM